MRLSSDPSSQFIRMYASAIETGSNTIINEASLFMLPALLFKRHRRQRAYATALISSWLRAMRIRFLLASVIAVSNGLALAYWKTGHFDPLYAALTYAGVGLLHASVDLLNDYWDHRRGIDSATTRTKFSGGTGVLPEKILTPGSVYRAGVALLILGALVGAAVVATYFKSLRIVNPGFGSLFVGIRGAIIVFGTFCARRAAIVPAAIFVGV